MYIEESKKEKENPNCIINIPFILTLFHDKSKNKLKNENLVKYFFLTSAKPPCSRRNKVKVNFIFEIGLGSHA